MLYQIITPPLNLVFQQRLEAVHYQHLIKDYGHDGNPLESMFVYNTVGFTCDNILSSLNLKSPDYIKIDVDGIEHLILEGSRKTLESVKSILVEINDDFHDQATTTRSLLESCNFKLLHKKHSPMFDKQGAFGDGKVWNQIWIKNDQF